MSDTDKVKAASQRSTAGRTSDARSDVEILRESVSFLPPSSSSSSAPSSALAERLVRAYDAKLYREFALADLSRRDGRGGGALGLRWRTERNVVSGKGQFVCGATRPACSGTVGLRTYEVPFAWVERDEKRTALVKLRLCGSCAALAFARGAAPERQRTRSRSRSRSR